MFVLVWTSACQGKILLIQKALENGGMDGAEKCQSEHLSLKLCLERLAVQKIQVHCLEWESPDSLSACAKVPLPWDRGQKS